MEVSGQRLFLCGFCLSSGVGIFLGETLDAAGGVNEFLLAGEKGVAVRANFHAQHVALYGRTRGKGMSAGTVYRNSVIVGMNTGFHEAPIHRVRSARRVLSNTAASLGREVINNYTRPVKRLLTSRKINSFGLFAAGTEGVGKRSRNECASYAIASQIRTLRPDRFQVNAYGGKNRHMQNSENVVRQSF